MRGNKLGCSRGQFNNEVELAVFDTTLTEGKDVAAKGVVRRSNANTLDVTIIQPSSMLVVVRSATSEKRS